MDAPGIDALGDTDFQPLFGVSMAGWRMAGRGGFAVTEDGAVESYGGPGLFWYAPRVFDDVALRVAWRVSKAEDNSGLFIHIPPLTDSPQPAVDHGYEIQIDERGFDPQQGRGGSPLHLTGAIYRLAPVERRVSRPIGQWNEFEVVALGHAITVRLNGELTAALRHPRRRRSGHIGLQAHHPGSAVQFRDLRACSLAGRAASSDPFFTEG